MAVSVVGRSGTLTQTGHGHCSAPARAAANGAVGRQPQGIPRVKPRWGSFTLKILLSEHFPLGFLPEALKLRVPLSPLVFACGSVLPTNLTVSMWKLLNFSHYENLLILCFKILYIFSFLYLFQNIKLNRIFSTERFCNFQKCSIKRVTAYFFVYVPNLASGQNSFWLVSAC